MFLAIDKLALASFKRAKASESSNSANKSPLTTLSPISTLMILTLPGTSNPKIDCLFGTTLAGSILSTPYSSTIVTSCKSTYFSAITEAVRNRSDIVNTFFIGATHLCIMFTLSTL